MKKKRSVRIFVGDFETTVYDQQINTEVWSSAFVEIGKEKVIIHNSIGETLDYFTNMNGDVIIYYHNLKFDGEFWLSYLLTKRNFTQAFELLEDDPKKGIKGEWLKNKNMPNNSFKFSMTTKGQFYTLTIKVNNKIIELRDSLKLLPFRLKSIGESFKTKHQKLDMDYKGFRYSGCEITEEEQEYIKNDVLVIKEALELMFSEGHNKLTIGSCCLEEFKSFYHKEDYENFFPKLTTIPLEELNTNYYEYVRNSYRGGWCYVVKGKEERIYYHGVTCDVNSLYPSVMHSMSGNRYPIGKPVFWKGNYIPDKALGNNKYYFIRIKTRFYLKDNRLPFIQIKNSYLYKGNENLESSDVLNPKDGKYYNTYVDRDGVIQDTKVTLTLTMTDYQLLLDQYELVDFEILDGCWFYSEIGLFDEYINKYKTIKQTSKGAQRTLAKLFLNNLYGKMASSTDSSFKIAYVKPDGTISYRNVLANDKQEGYIPIGSAITSYARDFTIRTAQANFYGKDKKGFIYADTDSIHCDISIDELVNVPIHESEFCHWKIECLWEEAIFTRQKTYIEKRTHIEKGGELIPIEEDYKKYDVKCAGMGDKCKHILISSLTGKLHTKLKENELTKDDWDCINTKRTLRDFKEGLRLSGDLNPKRIIGGILLVEDWYTMK
jgi:hypothetical protein